MKKQRLVRTFLPVLVLVLFGCGVLQGTGGEADEAIEADAGDVVEEEAAEIEEPAPEPEPVEEPTAVPTEAPPTPEPEPTAIPEPEPLTVLLVVEDWQSGRPDFTSSDEIAESLATLDVDYETWSTYDDDFPSRTSIGQYDVVIWAVGDDCCDSPPTPSVEVMIDYLSDGGNLLIEGGSVAGPWANHSFVLDYLGIGVTGFNVIGDIVVEDADHPLAEGFPSEPITLSVSGFVPPDMVEAIRADTVFSRGPNSAAAGTTAISAHDSGDFRVVFSAAPLQWFPNPDRERFLENTLGWFGETRLSGA